MNKILIVVLMLLIAGCTSKPVLNLYEVTVPGSTNGKTSSIETVQSAIILAAKRKGWSPRVIKPGLIEASINVRSHSAKVAINYTEASYNIEYLDSHNLKYNGKKIHRNYNNWVVNLSRTIQQELGVNTQRF